MKCNLCPRRCNTQRNETAGFCGMTETVTAARAALHMWEEPCISGTNGSGAVFFSGCTLRCVFCQNHAIASGKSGRQISNERLSEIFLELQDKHANNINLVTPTHYVPMIAKALDRAFKAGLIIPIVYNTSAYENIETLKIMDGLVDVYLPDMKYMDSALSAEYSGAPDYFQAAKPALAEMYRQTGKPKFFGDEEARGLGIESGIMKKGVIVRHLMLPGQLEDSKNIIKYVYDTYGDDVFISLMNQYTPLEQVKDIPALNKRVTEEEYQKLIDFARGLGVVNGFIQEGGTAKESFVPEFDCEGV